ncbi:hypothetical protein JYU34_006299 [Plutella xylostella]|uniref:Uncharacterized protein n=1 Tax=Plutella xylostella TaxID=51655 RepID=A0ABQ7QRP6_PLUXY|nr:hypothetical protein JYU34_006299 [Plutella xylostella]
MYTRKTAVHCHILREFNPALRGFSTGTGEWLAKNSRLNVAFPVASDMDAFKQAKVNRRNCSRILFYEGAPQHSPRPSKSSRCRLLSVAH